MTLRVPAGIDPELERAAALQPDLDFADAISARAGLARALKLSRALSRGPACEDGLLVTERRVESQDCLDDIPVRVYEPLQRDGALPALVYFHGGGFVAGDLETDHVRCATLARGGAVVVVSVQYRLAPEHPFPAALHDCYDALVWTHVNAHVIGVDPALLAVGGSSAGAALAAAVTLMARDQDGPRPAFQMLLYPVTDDRMSTASMTTFNDTPGWNGRNSVHMWRHYIGEATGTDRVSGYAAPARAMDLARLPDAYVLTAEYDPLRDEGRQYAARLQQAGVATELRQFPGTFHNFDAAVPVASVSVRALDEQCARLLHAFGRHADPSHELRGAPR